MSNTISPSRNSTVSNAQRASSPQRAHTVQRGDTMWDIAKKNDVSLDDLKKANPHIKNPDRIFPGQQLTIPERQGGATGANAPGAGGAGNTQAATQASPYQDGASRFEPSSQAPAPQVQARPGAPAQAPAGDPALSQQANAMRASQNAAGVGGARAQAPQSQAPQSQAPQSQPQAPGNLHAPVSDGRLGNVPTRLGQDTSGGVGFTRDAQGRTVRSQTSGTTTHSADGLSTSVQNREATARNQAGQSVHSLSENVEVRDRNSGQTLREETRVSQNSRGRTRSSTEVEEEEDNHRLSDDVNATGRLFEQTVAGDDKYHGVATVDRSMTEDRTGAGYEAHVLAAQGKVSTGGTVNLRNGEVNLGINAAGRADVAGVSGRAQLGSTSTMAGAGFVEGEAHVGARGEAGAGVGLDVANGEARARIGGEVFVGAEVRATGGYENRYGGVSATARGQAGAGVAAGADVSYSDGTFRARADLGAAVGLGGRITVDVNVNVENIAKDAWQGVQNAGDWVGSWFD